MNEHIVVISGSAPLAPHVIEAVPDEALVLAVDGGLDHALAAGLTPSGLIGDLDSVSPAGLEWATAHATISRHPSDKNETDTELALAFAADMNPARLTLIGGGDRFDHSVAAIGALGHHALTSIPHLDAWWNGEHLDVLHGPGTLELDLTPASTVSLLALHGPCRGVSISGTKWELDRSALAALVGLGVSNEVDDGGVVTIRLSTGVLTIFDQPASPPTLSARKDPS